LGTPRRRHNSLFSTTKPSAGNRTAVSRTVIASSEAFSDRVENIEAFKVNLKPYVCISPIPFPSLFSLKTRNFSPLSAYTSLPSKHALHRDKSRGATAKIDIQNCGVRSLVSTRAFAHLTPLDFTITVLSLTQRTSRTASASEYAALLVLEGRSYSEWSENLNFPSTP
jgi:hypothetical protein